MDWQEKNFRKAFPAPVNVAVNPDTYGNVMKAGYEAKSAYGTKSQSIFGDVPAEAKAEQDAAKTEEKASEAPETPEAPKASLAQKFDTCANGSCATPQWPGEILPGSTALSRRASSPVDEGYNPTLNAVFDNRWNVQMNEKLNLRSLAQKFDTCTNGSCATPQWPGEVLPGSKAILPIPSSPVDEGYRPTLNAVFDNRWN